MAFPNCFLLLPSSSSPLLPPSSIRAFSFILNWFRPLHQFVDNLVGDLIDRGLYFPRIVCVRKIDVLEPVWTKNARSHLHDKGCPADRQRDKVFPQLGLKFPRILQPCLLRYVLRVDTLFLHIQGQQGMVLVYRQAATGNGTPEKVF